MQATDEPAGTGLGQSVRSHGRRAHWPCQGRPTRVLMCNLNGHVSVLKACV
jgi:hypothetical protein